MFRTCNCPQPLVNVGVPDNIWMMILYLRGALRRMPRVIVRICPGRFPLLLSGTRDPGAAPGPRAANNKTLKFIHCDCIESAGEMPRYWRKGLWPSPEWRRAPAVFAFSCSQMMNNGSAEFKMMTRWSTDACRRDPSIVSSNLTNPTFSERFLCSLPLRIFLIWVWLFSFHVQERPGET